MLKLKLPLWWDLKKYLLAGILIFFLTSCGKLKQSNPHDPNASSFEGPKVTIERPREGDTVHPSSYYKGSAEDFPYGQRKWITDTNKYIWSSNIDGKMFTGRENYSYSLTTFGKHTITLKVEDEDGNIGYAKVNITYKDYGQQ